MVNADDVTAIVAIDQVQPVAGEFWLKPRLAFDTTHNVRTLRILIAG